MGTSPTGGRCKATSKKGFKLPWREAGPPNHHSDTSRLPIKTSRLSTKTSRLSIKNSLSTDEADEWPPRKQREGASYLSGDGFGLRSTGIKLREKKRKKSGGEWM